MANKKSILLTLATTMMLASCSCSGPVEVYSGGGGGKTSSKSTTSQSGESQQHVDGYEDWINSWSKEGHLYLHYLRPDASASDYDKYCVWLWQHKPHDLEGTLWGYGSETKVSDKLTLKPMSTSWMSASDVGREGSGAWNDEYGRIMDIDLNATGMKGGKSGKPVTFEGATEVGFLMVDESSMDGSKNWTSDGGKETYIKEFDQHFRSNGAMHVFLVSGDFKNYKFESGQQEIRVNPVTKDTSGKYRSKTQVIDSSKAFDPVATKTSDEFKSLGVGYQIFVASFADSDGDGMGDLRGIINKLDYLDDLGVQVLWLTPIQQSDSYHGYDISDYFAVDSKFGTIDDYRELIYKAHQKGMKVLMDLVLNHTSKNNVWFEKSQWAVNSEGAEKDETGIEWRNVYSWKYKDDEIQKYNATSKKYETITVEQDANSDNPSWYRDGESEYYYYGKFGSGMPEINYEYQPTRDLVKDMARYWLSFGLDGYRLDAVKHIYMKDEVADTGDDIIIPDVGIKSSYDDEKGKDVEKAFDYSSDLNKNVLWWREFANDVKHAYPNCFLVGENFDGWGNRMSPYYQALDSQFDFANYYHTAQFLYSDPDKKAQDPTEQRAGKDAGSYASSHYNETYKVFGGNFEHIKNDYVDVWQGGKRADYINGAYTSNHDVDRAINKVNGTWYINDKDEADSKAAAEVTGSAQEIGRAKIMGAMAILQPGISWIYYGDELGMSGNTNTHVATYGNENSMDIWYRQPMKWEKGETEETTGYKAGQYAFEWDSYNKNLDGVKEQKADANSMYNWYKALNTIKQQYPKNAKVTFENGDDILVFNISGDSGKQFKIYINIGQKASKQYILNPGSGWNLDNSDAAKTLRNNKGTGEFPTNSYSVYVYSK